jgi:hypothetical protein
MDILELLAMLIEAVRNNRYDDAQDSMNFFRRIALTSPDFIDQDSSQLVKLVQERVN